MIQVMKNTNAIKRLAKNAIMLAMLCVIGMFSLPLGDNIKVSLQLLMVFIIGLTITTFYDGIIITGLY
jgi:thiamine transporter ThiT